MLSFYTGAFYAEIFRGGIVSIEPGQWDAAKALGLRGRYTMAFVVLPQAVRRMVPPFMNQSIIQLKNTSLVSTIAVPDLLYQGTLITADTYRPLETYTVVALIYFVLLFPATRLVQAYEQRLAESADLDRNRELWWRPNATYVSVRRAIMLKWAIIFFIVSVVAGVFGFTGISAASAGIAKILFFIAVVVFLIFLALALFAGNAIL